jgi:hypothetical protein
MLVQQGQQQPVVGAEIMAPFADAMRLVDREQGDVGSAAARNASVVARSGAT